MCLMFDFWGKKGWKYCSWKIWVEFMCFWQTFNLILMHFIHEILCIKLRSFCIKFLFFFFKNLSFPNFQSIETNFQLIEICQGMSLKRNFSHMFVILFKLFFDQSNLSLFCRFLPQISQGFLSSSLSKSLLSFFFSLKSHFSCIFIGNFEQSIFWIWDHFSCF